MEERILLATYVVKIYDNNKNQQVLSHFNGTDDFLRTFRLFTEYIFENVNQLPDLSGRRTIHLTLEEPAITEEDNRCIYGYFSSGVSGEKYRLVNTNTNETEMDVDTHHAAFRNVFFYFYVPRNRNIGYLILQRKQHFGIKTKLIPAINSYIRQEGYQLYNVHINNLVHNSVYNRMMRDGNLKKVELVKRRIPRSLESYIEGNEQPEEINGTFRSSFTSRISLPQNWKDYIDRIFRQHNTENATLDIQGLDDNFNDLEFELELNGKKKTFYVVNRQRIQPDIDVTRNVEFENDEPTTESLKFQAIELIEEMLEITPDNAE